MIGKLSAAKKTRLVFTMSVILNVFLLSAAAATAYRHWADHPWHDLKKSLAPETRHLIARNFQKAHRETKDLGIKARRARKNLVEIMAAEEFDEAAFDTAVERLELVKDEIEDRKIQAIKDLFSDLSLEDREKLAERMSEAIGGDFRRRGKALRSMRRLDRWSGDKGPQPISSSTEQHSPSADPPSPQPKPTVPEAFKSE